MQQYNEKFKAIKKQSLHILSTEYCPEVAQV